MQFKYNPPLIGVERRDKQRRVTRVLLRVYAKQAQDIVHALMALVSRHCPRIDGTRYCTRLGGTSL